MLRRFSTIAGAALAVALAAASSSFAARDSGRAGLPLGPKWEVALNHSRTLTAAKKTLALVQKQSRAKGLTAVIERDANGGKEVDYEVAITGFKTRAQAVAAQKQSKAGFKQASVETT